MRRTPAILTLVLLLLIAPAAKAGPPESWFIFDDILSLKQAEEIVEITRVYFWENGTLPPDGKPIRPRDEAERQTIPIERMDALFFSQKAQLAGLAMWCDLDPIPYAKHSLDAAWKKYRDLKQVVFASMLFGAVARDIKERKLSRGPCPAADKEATATSIRYVMEKSNPAVQGTLRDKAAQRP